MSDSPDFRVSDQEREATAEEIREHYAAGRLDDDELSNRLSAAYGAKTRAQLQEVRADLPALPASPAQQRAELIARRNHLTRRLLQQTGGSLGVFVLCTAIWAASGASGFFWPVFTLFAVLPLLRSGWALYGPAPELEHVERHLQSLERGEGRHDRDQRRLERHTRRDEHRRHRS